MTETIAERKLAKAVDWLQRMKRGSVPGAWTYVMTDEALTEIAALDAPPQPDLAEIGVTAYRAVRAQETDAAKHLYIDKAGMMAASDLARDISDEFLKHDAFDAAVRAALEQIIVRHISRARAQQQDKRLVVVHDAPSGHSPSCPHSRGFAYCNCQAGQKARK